MQKAALPRLASSAREDGPEVARRPIRSTRCEPWNVTRNGTELAPVEEEPEVGKMGDNMILGVRVRVKKNATPPARVLEDQRRERERWREMQREHEDEMQLEFNSERVGFAAFSCQP